ncbi:putative alpha-N-acetylgalactosaminide alpha-2, partial [Triplophysa rosa]
QRHGVAVFLAITMCTSLFLLYSVSYNNDSTASSASKGASGEKAEPTKETVNAHRTPVPLQGYSGIIDHKVKTRHSYCKGDACHYKRDLITFFWRKQKTIF